MTQDRRMNSEFPRYRNIPDAALDATQVAGRGWNVTDLLLPTAILRDTALQQNAALINAWCEQNRVSLAPHTKTHLSPQLVQLQLAHGAWGMTVASPSQARLLVAFGVRTLILANEVVDRPGIELVHQLRVANPDLRMITLVDSVEFAARLAGELDRLGSEPLDVLIEIGLTGQRAGIRDSSTGLELARAVAGSPRLRLVGIEGFEGVLTTDRALATVEAVRGLLQLMGDIVELADTEGLFETDEILYTAGGSFFPDLVAAAGRALPALSRPVRTVVRSGCSLTHDHGATAQVSPLSAAAGHELGALHAALEVWGYVVSTPEPGLAIIGLGKRDVSFDLGNPVLLRVSRAGEPIAVNPESHVARLNDQHAYLRHGGEVQLGDLVAVGPIHPCTTFDAWPLIPVIDDRDQVIGVVTTHF